ncbi:5-oxoprolinase subunit PxpA [Colwellia sp. BRX10-3]|uniref:5-oxoprolinase subunit PxpA n=1 Tax=Colwellia sp. BRX10-3 TaxID=2759844 RepID=UPI0015F5CBA6|nr:5-oxoprolinase subunit PxpA [Colwellia sp. BRX10-3]MBA6389883.1 5-oxoprolinase subunit PxpA [Colwellia sp. BRX10-3]
MKLNCDLGEFKENNDADIMPLIDMANIACGFHGSDSLTIKKTIKLAQQHQVIIGAHPSYPDVENFGRQSMDLSQDELIANVQYQIGALQALCAVENAQLDYVKPHGALYNDMMKNLNLFEDVCLAIAQLNQSNIKPLSLMIQALTDIDKFDQIAKKHHISLYYEAFADRAYLDNGLLVPRTETGAVLTNNQDVVTRCQALLDKQPLLSKHQQPLQFHIDALCVHGDTPNALAMLKALRATINAQGQR